MGCRRMALSLWNGVSGFFIAAFTSARDAGTEVVDEVGKQDTVSKQRMMPSSLWERARGRRDLLAWLVANVRQT